MEGLTVTIAASAIWIVCDDDSHPSKTCLVNFVVRDETKRWISSPGSSRKRGEFADMVSLDEDNQKLQPRPGVVESHYEQKGMQRRHFNFQCELCTHNEVRGRAETLDAVFNTLAQHGLDRISLNALVARLRST